MRLNFFADYGFCWLRVNWRVKQLAAIRTVNENESLHEARLAANVERVIVARKNKKESLREALLTADV